MEIAYQVALQRHRPAQPQFALVIPSSVDSSGCTGDEVSDFFFLIYRSSGQIVGRKLYEGDGAKWLVKFAAALPGSGIYRSLTLSMMQRVASQPV